MNKKTIIIVVVLIIVILVAVYFFMKNKSGAGKETTTSTSQTSGLAGLDLGGIFGSLIGGKKQPSPQNQELLTPGANNFLYGE